MNIFEQVKNLQENGLHSNVITLGSFYLSICENHNDTTITASSQYQTLVYIGKSLQYIGEHRRAEEYYKKALQFCKGIMKSKTFKSVEFFKDGLAEIDVKYHISECHIAMRELKQAASVLEMIPQRHRTVRVNMALGNLYKQGGMERPAIVAYKEVLRECPLAMDAIKELLSLGISGAEISSFLVNFSNNTPATEWITQWIKGHANMHSRDFPNAISTFKKLDEHSVLRKNPIVMCSLGEAYYISNDPKNAICTLQKYHAKDPRNLTGIDMLSSLLSQENRKKELASLARQAHSTSEVAPESWIALGYHSKLTKKTSKAIYFAHKACCLNPRSVEGLLLKGVLLFELKKYEESITHYREVMRIAPHRFEPYTGLIDCYIGMHRLRDAASFASNMCKIFGQTPLTITLYASVLCKDSGAVIKAKSLLDKALKLDEYFLPAVYMYCDILAQEMQYARAIEMLLKQAEFQYTHKLHQMLADFYSLNQQEDQATHHYNIALKYFMSQGTGLTSRPLNSNSRLDAHTNEHLNEMEADENNESEGDVEESDLEAVWSDVDFSFGQN